MIGDLDQREVAVTVSKERDRIIELVRCLFHHDHADQTHAVLLAACDQSLSCIVCISGLSAQYAFIGDTARDQFMLVLQIEVVRLGFGRFEMVFGSIGYAGEHIV